jgi:hypothetical protein
MTNGVFENSPPEHTQCANCLNTGWVAGRVGERRCDCPCGEIQPVRFEVTLERQVIVYAPDIATASLKALQVDGVAGRYKVIECLEVGPSALEERPKLIDVAPSRETQK